MPILKKRDHQTETRLLLESAEPVELPPAEVADDAVLVQFDRLRPYIPELLAELRAGGRALLVGGCVRDVLMGTQPKDWDVEVYGVEPARLRQLLDQLGDVNVVGEAFTVYKLGADLDVGLTRREHKTGRGQ